MILNIWEEQADIQHNYYFAGEQPWRNEENLVVLSNGDTLGPSYHGDFINGVRDYPSLTLTTSKVYDRQVLI